MQDFEGTIDKKDCKNLMTAPIESRVIDRPPQSKIQS